MNALDLAFDQYQRYRLASDLLDRLPAGTEPTTVLDVGGRTALLRPFRPSDRITVVDLEPTREERAVLGDGCRLPFRDRSFDVVAAFDTLEHVRPELRTQFVTDCARVARKWVMLIGPYDAPRTVEAETLLARFLEEKLGTTHRYLAEHRANGLPSREETERLLRESGARVVSFGHANLDRWLAMMLLSMYLEHDPALRDLGRAVQRFYNSTLYDSDHAEPVYRHVVVAVLDGSALPDADGLRGEAGAPPGSLLPFAELSRELVAFDRARDEWRVERDRLREVAADLRLDLEGHREALAGAEAHVARILAEFAAERAQQAQVIAGLDRDLGEHRESVAHLGRELEAQIGHNAELLAASEAERRASATAIDELSADLAAHHATLEALRADMEEERRAHAAIDSEKERDLAGRAATLATLRADLTEHAAMIGALEATLEELRRDTASMRAEYESDLEQHRASLATERADGVERRKAFAVLERDLAGHRAKLGALEALRDEDRAGHEAAERALRADLVEHERSLRTLAADLAEHRAKCGALERELEVQRADTDAMRAVLERDVAAHRESLRTARADLAEHRGTLAALRRELEREHAEREQLLALLARERAEAAAVRADLERDLAGHRESLDDMRRLLGSRLKNAKRALFGWRSGPRRDRA